MRSVRNLGAWPKGTVLRIEHKSVVLRENPWSDPADRIVHVYLPASYRESESPLIALWDLAAYTNSGPGHLNWRGHGENLQSRLDRLIGEGALPPVVVVIPDCYTSLGGNQYVNSASVGRYADYLVSELVPFITSRVNVVDRRLGRGLFGKSSGGFGALYHGMHYSEVWGAVASHAGDVGFEWIYKPAFPEVCTVLSQYAHNSLEFIRAFWGKSQPSNADFLALMMLAMAASYDPDSSDPSRIRLPVDPETCELDGERWRNWLAFDPLHSAEKSVNALKSLAGIYLDVGKQDQYHTQFGTRQLVKKLGALGLSFQFEEFEGNHSDMDRRLDFSLPFLASRLKNALAAAT